MERKIKTYGKKRLSDRDFLFGIFREKGVGKRVEEFSNSLEIFPFREQDTDEFGNDGPAEDGPSFCV
jgi:hypothetical protein